MTDPFIPRSILLQWHVTDACPLRCRHCYGGTGSPDLPFDAILRILEGFRSLVSSFRSAGGRTPAHANITGGEPLLREDFPRLLERFRELQGEFGFAVLTGGAFVDDAAARLLKKTGARFVQVSLDGEPATHDSIRGAGNHAAVVAGIRTLKKHGLPVMISFTAGTENFREFPQVARLGKELGVERVWADRFLPTGAVTGDISGILTPGETSEFIAMIAREARRGFVGGNPVSPHRALQFLGAGGRPYRCTAGDELITVLPDGALLPCRRLPVPAGNVLETPLTNLYHGSKVFSDLRRIGSCSASPGCTYSRACRGGLRCLTYAVTGSIDGTDPGCPLVAGA